MYTFTTTDPQKTVHKAHSFTGFAFAISFPEEPDQRMKALESFTIDQAFSFGRSLHPLHTPEDIKEAQDDPLKIPIAYLGKKDQHAYRIQ